MHFAKQFVKQCALTYFKPGKKYVWYDPPNWLVSSVSNLIHIHGSLKKTKQSVAKIRAVA